MFIRSSVWSGNGGSINFARPKAEERVTTVSVCA